MVDTNTNQIPSSGTVAMGMGVLTIAVFITLSAILTIAHKLLL